MPVTARLSKSFYDRFGDEAANELVEWFNAVDATYRGDLRELNETNFARFEATMNARFTQLDATWETRFARSEANIDARFRSLESLLREHMLLIDARMSTFEARMMRWMLTFWVGTLGGLAALVWAMARAR